MALYSQPTARALAILDLLMANPDQAFGLTQLTRRLNLNKATCHAILTTMATYGYLHQNPKSKAYRLGPSIIAAGHAALSGFPVLEYARPELEKMEKELELSFAVMGRSKTDLVLLALYGKAAPYRTAFHLGMRVPNIAPLGASFTAWAPAKYLEEWLEQGHEANGGYDEAFDQRLRIALIAIRSRGYEISLRTKADEEFLQHVMDTYNSLSLREIRENSINNHQKICQEHQHLDHIDPNSSYNIGNITVPVFVAGHPIVTFVARPDNPSIKGSEVTNIAERMKQAAEEVAKMAEQEAPKEFDSM